MNDILKILMFLIAIMVIYLLFSKIYGGGKRGKPIPLNQLGFESKPPPSNNQGPPNQNRNPYPAPPHNPLCEDIGKNRYDILLNRDIYMDNLILKQPTNNMLYGTNNINIIKNNPKVKAMSVLIDNKLRPLYNSVKSYNNKYENLLKAKNYEEFLKLISLFMQRHGDQKYPQRASMHLYYANSNTQQTFETEDRDYLLKNDPPHLYHALLYANQNTKNFIQGFISIGLVLLYESFEPTRKISDERHTDCDSLAALVSYKNYIKHAPSFLNRILSWKYLSRNDVQLIRKNSIDIVPKIEHIIKVNDLLQAKLNNR